MKLKRETKRDKLPFTSTAYPQATVVQAKVLNISLLALKALFLY